MQGVCGDGRCDSNLNETCNNCFVDCKSSCGMLTAEKRGSEGERGKRKEGRGKREEGRGKREEGRGKREEGGGRREEQQTEQVGGWNGGT